MLIMSLYFILSTLDKLNIFKSLKSPYYRMAYICIMRNWELDPTEDLSTPT